MSSSDAEAERPGVVVRSARADDGPALQRIDVATFAEDLSPGPPPQPDADFFGGRVTPANVLVAEVDGEVAGYITVAPQYRLTSSAHVVQIQGLAAVRSYAFSLTLPLCPSYDVTRYTARTGRSRCILVSTSASCSMSA